MNTIFKYVWPSLVDEEKMGLKKVWVEYIAQVPEMVTWFIQAIYPSEEIFESVKALLMSKWTVDIVWQWQLNWLQSGYEIVDDIIVKKKDEDWLDVVINYPFDIEKYRAWLLNNITYDEAGYILTDEPYTTLEARNKQVNKFGGASDRSLI